MSRTQHVKLAVYIRVGCGLCEDMLLALQPWSQRPGIDIEVFDIDEDEQLRQRYDTRVPVLTCDGEFVCEYFLDPVTLETMLAAGAGPEEP